VHKCIDKLDTLLATYIVINNEVRREKIVTMNQFYSHKLFFLKFSLDERYRALTPEEQRKVLGHDTEENPS
jgi:hypothetical protein